MPQFQFDGSCLGKDKVFGQANRETTTHFQVARLGHGQVAGLQITLQVQRTTGDGNRTVAGDCAGNGQGAALGGDGPMILHRRGMVALARDGMGCAVDELGCRW